MCGRDGPGTCIVHCKDFPLLGGSRVMAGQPPIVIFQLNVMQQFCLWRIYSGARQRDRARTCYLYLFCPSSLPSLFSLKGSSLNILKNITWREGNQGAFVFFYERKFKLCLSLKKLVFFSIWRLPILMRKIFWRNQTFFVWKYFLTAKPGANIWWLSGC